MYRPIDALQKRTICEVLFKRAINFNWYNGFLELHSITKAIPKLLVCYGFFVPSITVHLTDELGL